MADHFFKTVKNSIRHWYIPFIIGLLFIGVGLYTFLSPVNSYAALAFVFSISFLFSGLSEIGFALANKDRMDNWGWTLVFGLMTFFIGVLLLARPEISRATLSFYVGFLVLFRSISAVSYAIDLKNYGVAKWSSLMIIGVLGFIFSFILIWNPLIGGMTIVIWTGLAFLSTGIFGIYLSLKLRKLNNASGNISEELKGKLAAVKKEIQEELNKQ